jgi:hypothetical protein
MESVDLPMYDAQGKDSLTKVLAELHERKRSGIVLRERHSYRIFFIGDLLTAQQKGLTNLQELAGGAVVDREQNAEQRAYVGVRLSPHEYASYDNIFLKMASPVSIGNMGATVSSSTGNAPEMVVSLASIRRTTAGRNAAVELNYIVHAINTTTALIITRHETWRDALNLTGAYRCDGSGDDYFPSTDYPNVNAGDECPRYPLCKRAEGGRPRVYVV